MHLRADGHMNLFMNIVWILKEILLTADFHWIDILKLHNAQCPIYAPDICFVLIKSASRKEKGFSCFLDAFTCRQRHEFMHEFCLDLERNLAHSRLSLNGQYRSYFGITQYPWNKFILSGPFWFLIGYFMYSRIYFNSPNIQILFWSYLSLCSGRNIWGFHGTHRKES